MVMLKNLRDLKFELLPHSMYYPVIGFFFAKLKRLKAALKNHKLINETVMYFEDLNESFYKRRDEILRKR